VYTETLPVVLLFSVRACDVHFDLCINVQRCAGVLSFSSFIVYPQPDSVYRTSLSVCALAYSHCTVNIILLYLTASRLVGLCVTETELSPRPTVNLAYSLQRS